MNLTLQVKIFQGVHIQVVVGDASRGEQYEITENAQPLYYGRCSFDSFTRESSIYLFTLQDAFILIASSSEGDNIHFFDNIIACQNKCHHYLLDTIDYLEVEIENYQEFKHSGIDITHFSITLDWYFDLTNYLNHLGTEREGNEPNAPICSKSVIYENSFR
jgi:hypothetical protein